jgi:hypothetical protein
LLSDILNRVDVIKELTTKINERGREKKYDVSKSALDNWDPLTSQQKSVEIEATAWQKAHAHYKKKDDDLMTEYEDDISALLTFARSSFFLGSGVI